MHGGDYAVVPQRKEVAGHCHDFGVGGADDLDLAVVKERFEGLAQDVDAGDGEAGGGHAEQDVEVEEMFREGDFFNLPTVVGEVGGKLVGAGFGGADAGVADDEEAGLDDMDVAALQGASCGVAVETVILGVKVEQRGVFAAALRHGEAGKDRSPGRGLGGVPGVDLVGQLGLGHGVVDGDAGGGKGAFKLVVLVEAAFRVGGGAGGEGGVGDGVGVDPLVVVRRAEEHVLEGAGFGLYLPALAHHHGQAAFLTSRFWATRTSAICTAFKAAPLRRLSDTHQKARPCGTVWSMRMRLT